MSAPGFMICVAGEPDSPFRCHLCGKPVRVSEHGKRRAILHEAKEGTPMWLLCNPCGSGAIKVLNEHAEQKKIGRVEISILPNAQDAIKELDPQFAEWLDKNAEKEKP